MSNKLKYSQLAKALGLTNASISMAVKNEMLIVDLKNKTISIDLPVNKMWIDNQVLKGKTFDLNKIFNKPKPQKPVSPSKTPTSKKPPPVKNEVSISDLQKLEIRKKKAEIKRTESATKLNELRIEKQEGKLIPFDEAEFLLTYIVEKIRNTSIQEIDSISNIYKERFDISHVEYIEIKKDLTDIINGIIKDSVSEMKSGIKGIQEKYQEVRGKGERVN